MIKHVCLFLPHKRTAESDAHLVCRIKWNGCRSIVSLNLGFVVDPDKWDKESQACKPRSSHGPMRIPAQVINAEIERYDQTAAALFKRYAEEFVWPTADRVREDMKVALGLSSPDDLTTVAAYEQFMNEESVRRAWSLGTEKKLKTVKAHLLGFPPFLSFDGFTSFNFAKYVQYLREDLGHNDVTVHRQLGYVRWFCAWAERKGLLKCNDYAAFKPKLKAPDKPVIFLEWEELMRLWDYEAPENHPYLNDVRDVFLFCCFTSLRYSDAQNLHWSDFFGTSSFRIVAQKTAKASVIELNKWSNEIVSRHVDRDHGDDHALPQIPNQVMNRYLKTICKSIGLDTRITIVEYRGGERIEKVREKWELVGTHAGRRTFICNALRMGISPTVVMQWTGHADYRAMRPYIAVTSDEKRNAMALFDQQKTSER